MSKTNSDKQPLKREKDYYLYTGGITRNGYEKLTKIVTSRTDKKDKGVLVLMTLGGDPDAGYRMGRAMGHYYPNGFDIFVPDMCKSAGTLLCIAAETLSIGDRGELGPLDIQLSKPDEMFESSSGLDIIQSIAALRQSNLEAFRNYLVDVRIGSQLSTKLAAEIATKLANGLINPIASQIDPIRWGEHQRAISIAHAYGNRLNEKFKNLKEHSLERLVSTYPCHGFVIDRKEAGKLFERVREPDGIEVVLSNFLLDKFDVFSENLFDLNEIIDEHIKGTLGATTHENTESGTVPDAGSEKQNNGKDISPANGGSGQNSKNRRARDAGKEPNDARNQ